MHKHNDSTATPSITVLLEKFIVAGPPLYTITFYLQCLQDTSESRSKIPEKFWNVVLEKDREYQLDGWKSVKKRNEEKNILQIE